MRQHLLALLVRISLICCVVAMPVASMAADDHARLVERVWQAAHLTSLSDSMAANLLAGIEQHPQMQALSEGKRERLMAHYRRHSRPERFTRGLRRVLDHAPDRQLHALLTLANSEVARRALTEELAYQTVPIATLNAHARRLQNTEEGRARTAAIKRLDQAIGVTDMAVSVTASTLFGTAAAMRQAGGEKQLASHSEMAEQVARFAASVRPWQAEQVKITYLYLYRNLPLSDLKAYVAMQEHLPVKSIQRSFVHSLGAELIAIQRDVIGAVIEDMQGRGIRDA